MSISKKALIVNLTIGTMPKTRKVRQASEEIEINKKTAANQAAVVTKLFDKDDISDLDKVMGEARARFRELTLPYGKSAGLIPTTRYFDFLQEMSTLRSRFDSAKERIVNSLDRILENAKRATGDLYDPANYPAKYDLANSMYFSIEMTPVPADNAYDDLANLTPQEIEFLKNEAVINNANKIEAATKDLFKRLLSVLKHTAERLEDDEEGPKIFRDSLLENIEKALEAAQTLNLTDDENLSQLTESVKEIFDGVTANDLRKDAKLRAETQAKASSLVDRISALL